MGTDQLFIAADAAHDAGDYATALRLFREAAALGDAHAMSRIACMYDNGEGVHRDVTMSIAWDLKAIGLGNVTSMLNLAVTYRRLGDIRTARDWFERALEAGDGSAALELAKLYSVSEKEVDAVTAYLRRALASDDLSPADRDEAQEMLAAYAS